VELLADGKGYTEVAERLGVSRSKLARWRWYSPEFQAALNRRRSEAWGTGIDQLRALVPIAIGSLKKEMTDSFCPNRLQAAVAVLKIVGIQPGNLTPGPVEADEIVRNIVVRRRQHTPTENEERIARFNGLVPFATHVEQVRRELQALADSPDEETTPRVAS
jgi:hypothetical protein